MYQYIDKENANESQDKSILFLSNHYIREKKNETYNRFHDLLMDEGKCANCTQENVRTVHIKDESIFFF